MTKTMDVNGDGKTDYVMCDFDGYWKIFFGTGYTSPVAFTAPVNPGILCYSYADYARSLSFSSSNAIDYDGDGMMDLVVPYANNRWYVLRSNGAGFDPPLDTGLSDGGYSSSWHQPPIVMDFDGDGRQDIVTYYGSSWVIYKNNGQNTWSTITTGIPSSSYGSAMPVDYDGDGRMDLLVPGPLGGSYTLSNWYVLKSSGTTFTVVNTGLTTANTTSPILMDINGDGRPDLVYIDAGYWKIRLNTGAGFGPAIPTTISSSGYLSNRQIDYDGDGKMDLMLGGSGGMFTTNHWYLLRSTGNGFSAPFDTGINTLDTQIVDSDGDGMQEVMYRDSSFNWYMTYPASLGGVPADLLQGVTNGLGTSMGISYNPISNSINNVIYTKGSGATFPRQDWQAPLYVVSDYSTSDGIGGNYRTTYRYQKARFDLQGRGFLGFGQITATDTQTGISTQTQYMLAFPGGPIQTSVTKSYNNAVISSVVNAVSSFGYRSPGMLWHLFVYVKNSVETRYELSGNSSYVVATVSTDNYYESQCGTDVTYCNLRQIEVTTTDAAGNTFTKTTTNTYATPDTARWILGRLTSAQVTSWLPTGAYQGRASAFSYDPTTGLLLTEVVEPNGNTGSITNMTQTTTYAYDGFGNKISATVSGADGISRPAYAVNKASTASAPYAYTAGRFETDLTNAISQGETRVYDARFGTVATLTGPNGLSTNWQYDSFGRKQKETRADGTTTWSYSLCGTCPTNAKYYVTQTTPGAPTVTVYYDLLDRELRTQTVAYNGALIYKDTIYNTLGQVAKVSRPYYSSDVPYWTYFSYDALGRVTSQSLPTQATTAGTLLGTTAYNGLTTVLTQYRDGTALTTTQVKDALGELVSVTDANGYITRYEYDPFGNLTKVTDPALNVTTMTYDIRGRKLTMTDPDMGYWQYSYNSVGELVKQIDAKGQTVSMTYDALGRMSSRSEAEGTTRWIYDSSAYSGLAAKGKLSKVTWPGGSRTFVYDGIGRPVTETTTLSGVSYSLITTYDSNSRVDTVTYPDDFAVRNNYNLYGYLSSVTNAATGTSYWNAPAYNAAGQVSTFTLGNNLITVNKYNDGTGLLEGISTGVGLSGSAIQYLTYQYDTLGNLKQRVDGNQANRTENFGYDNLNRMTSANIAGVVNKTVSYDSLGNITTKSDVGTYTYDPLHSHAVKTAGSGSYTYDANGNQLTGPNGRSISYTSFNQPRSITQGGKTNSFTYDGDHQRVMETTSDGTTITIHPRIDLGAHYEQVRKTNGTVEYKNYIYAGKDVIAVYTMRSNNVNDTRYFHKDHLGSIDTITNETGQVVERLSYDAWGKRRNGNWTDATTAITSLTHHGFTGHEMMDDVGLINMNGRIYDPTLARFLSADPTVQSPGNPQTLNRYSYANNNPLTYVDPSGYGFFSKLWKSIIRPIIAIVAAVYVGVYFSILSGYGFIGGAIGGFVGGFIGSGGNLQAGLAGAITGGIFGGIGDFALSQRIGGAANWGMGEVNSVLAHAVGGGVSSVLQGQKFGIGAISAGFSEGFSPFYGRAPGGLIGQTVAAATVGGTAARIGGGKFENGAKTSAFAYLFSSAGSSVAQNGVGGSLAALGRGALDVIGKVWALPNTLIGFTVGMAGVPFGGDWPTFGNNAIQFENNPLASGGAITFGNAIVYGGSRYDLAADGNQFWRHEMQHTYQAQILGPLYLPSNILGGTVSAVTGGGWHGPLNWNEIGPQQHPPQPW